jgi:enoyl-CoA hydratase/carnithine racemase
MLADIRIASRDAPLGLNFVKLGLHPGMAATHFLPQLLGPQLANYLLLTGELITGEEAERRGFVLRAVPTPKDAFENALQLARTIAAASPVAVRLVTKTIRARQDAELERNIVREADGQAHCYASPDILEGLAAVRDKRPPSFY